MDTLAFALYGQRAGIITRDGGRLSLAYDTEYLADPTATPLSLSLPLTDKAHHNRAIEAYLRGLLPDHDGVRRRWAQAFGLRDKDTLGLIRAIGLDCAGGALFAPENELESALSRKGNIKPLTEEQIGSHLRLLRQDETAWHEEEDEHWSLAGGQSKFTLVKTRQKWARTSGSLPSTHIIKPGISRIPAQALTEHVSMRALSLLGEHVAHSEYYEFDGEPAIVVKRFDRLVGKNGEVLRLHSEDLVQSFGLDPSRKYESDGGPGVERISTLLAGTTDRLSTERFAHAVIANYILGAPDAHAKNYSLLLAQNTATLAPLYDVASGFIGEAETGRIRYRKTAMSIGGHTVFGEVTGREWRKFARMVQQEEDKVFAFIAQLATQLPDALNDAIHELPHDVQGFNLLISRLLPRVAALAQHTLTTIHTMEPRTSRVTTNLLSDLNKIG